MKKPRKYDVFVIGTGSAGKTVAEACAEKGLKVGIADKRAYGGTCALRGCDPKKVLLTIGDLAGKAGRLTGKGVSSPLQTSWKELQAFKQSFTEQVPQETENELEGMGIDLYYNSPSFTDEKTIKIKNTVIQADKYVIASGMEPVTLDIPGEDLLLQSDDFLSLEEQPASAIIIGGGYVGMEFAHFLAHMGTQVTVVDSGKRILSNFDEDLVENLQERSAEMGIKIIHEADITSVKKAEGKIAVTYKENKKSKKIKAAVAINAAGRKPAIDKLKLKRAGIKSGKEGVQVNEFLQSVSNKRVYACGDVAAHSLPLTPLAGIEGDLVAHNITRKKRKKIEIPAVPSVVFTSPNLCSVGMMEEDARKSGRKIKVILKDNSEGFHARRLNESAYMSKIILDKESGKILGAHILGPGAVETINLLALAMKANLTAEEYKNTIFTYPSLGNDTKSMLEDS